MKSVTDEDLERDEAVLRAAVAQAQADLEECLAARRYLQKRKSLGQIEPDLVMPDGGIVEFKRVDVAKRTLGLTDTIIRVLSLSDEAWLTANQIQLVASSLVGSPVKMSSISPKLSDLKNKKLIVRDDMKVALAARVPASFRETPRDGSREVSMF